MMDMNEIMGDDLSENLDEILFEQSASVNVVEGILMLKNIRDAINHVTEFGTGYGWDSDLRDDIIDYLISEREIINSQLLQDYHEAKMAIDVSNIKE